MRARICAVLIDLTGRIQDLAMSKNTQEYRTLLGATGKLMQTVKDSITPLCAELVSHYLITPDNSTKLMNRNVDELDRAAELVSLVTDKVELCPDNYHIFVKILMEDRATYEEVLKVLEPVYKDPDEATPAAAVTTTATMSGTSNVFSSYSILSLILFKQQATLSGRKNKQLPSIHRGTSCISLRMCTFCPLLSSYAPGTVVNSV